MGDSSKLEELKEALLDLERSRQKESEERILAEAILKSLEIISSFNDQGNLVFAQIFDQMRNIIPFSSAFILIKDDDSEKSFKIIYSTENTEEKLHTLIYSDFLQKTCHSPRNILTLDQEHQLSALLDQGSALTIPFNIDDVLYFIIFCNSSHSAFQKKHLKIALKVSSVFKQAIINDSLISKLIYSDKMASIGLMAGGIAHEINNPLTIIQTTAKVMQKSYQKKVLTDQRLNEGLETILTTVNRISKIIHGLKTVSRQSQETELEKIYLHEILKDVLGMCEEKLKEQSVALLLDENSRDEKIAIFSERVQLSQVLLNLMNNAHDAIAESSKKRWIKIEIVEGEKYYFLRIIDSGTGIKPEIKNKIFNPFFTSKKVGKGTGLGLSVSLSIMRKLKGDLRLNEQFQNTCFEVSIPKRL